jgi:hypothetical protein
VCEFSDEPALSAAGSSYFLAGVLLAFMHALRGALLHESLNLFASPRNARRRIYLDARRKDASMLKIIDRAH